MTNLASGILAAVDAIGAVPGATEEEDLQRRYLVYMGVLMSFGGVMWGAAALALGLWVQSSIPLGYVAITAVNLSALHASRNIARARLLQVLASLLLPFLFQWALGGFVASGVVMLWSLVALFGSLLFSDARSGWFWLALFGGLTVVSGLVDPAVSSLPVAGTMAPLGSVGLVVNLLAVCGVTFGLTIALMSGRRRLMDNLVAATSKIANLNQALSERVREREQAVSELTAMEADLRRKTDELVSSLETLRSAQRELVRSEKLASLGGLVAGLAHEINTPLGVAVTAASLVRESVDGVRRQVEGPQVRRAALLEGLIAAQEAVATLEINIQRAAGLIRHFKTVSVDQTGDNVRALEIGSYLEEVLASLAPLLKRSRLAVRVDCPEPVPATTHPGALAQMVTNFVTNALHHAFDPDQDGELRFSVRSDAGRARLEVHDNGRGMPAEVAEKAFEPFFTTRGSSGGSGLGLFIVHNLVTEGLGGSISLESEPGRGTTFRVDFPLTRQEGT